MSRILLLAPILCLLSLSILLAEPSKDYQDIEPLSAKTLKTFRIKEPFKLDFKGKTYQIFSATSLNFTQDKPAKAFFLLDANKHFPMLLNALNASKFKEPFIVIGVGYDTNLGYDRAQRTRDYTPKVAGKEFQAGGGEGEFFEFIHSILVPKMQGLYPKIDQRGLFGHSFGGLFTLNALLNHELIFDGYFIASPSLWWGQTSFLPEQIRLLKCPQILITKGELEGSRGKSVLNAKELSLKIQSQSQCKLEFKEFKGQNHGSVIKPALIFAFENFVD